MASEIFATDINPNAIVGFNRIYGDHQKLSPEVKLDYAPLFGNGKNNGIDFVQSTMVTHNKDYGAKRTTLIYYDESYFLNSSAEAKKRCCPMESWSFIFSKFRGKITNSTKVHPIKKNLKKRRSI